MAKSQVFLQITYKKMKLRRGNSVTVSFPIDTYATSPTGCVIIIDAFLLRSPARTGIGSQTVDGCRRDPRQPSHMVGGE